MPARSMPLSPLATVTVPLQLPTVAASVVMVAVLPTTTNPPVAVAGKGWLKATLVKSPAVELLVSVIRRLVVSPTRMVAE